MDSPARIAFQLLVATGFGLLLATAFAIEAGTLSASVSLGWLIPLMSLISFSCALAVAGGISPFDSFFPHETTSQMQDRVEDEFNVDLKDGEVSDAWAKLEAEVLSDMMSESEE